MYVIIKPQLYDVLAADLIFENRLEEEKEDFVLVDCNGGHQATRSRVRYTMISDVLVTCAPISVWT